MTTRHPLLLRLLRGGFFVTIALVTLAALALAIISFQGRRDWAAVRQELRVKGEKLTRVELAPPPIPDERNFFADPLWRPAEVPPGAEPSTKSPFELLDTPLTTTEWTELSRLFSDDGNLGKDSLRSTAFHRLSPMVRDLPPAQRPAAETFLLGLVKPMAPVPAKIESLLARGDARFPFDYEGITWKSNPYPGLNNISALIAGHALLALGRGQTKEAARLTLDLIALSGTPARDPLLYAQMLRMGVLARAAGVIRTGLAGHLWSDGELAAFQETLARVDFLPGIALAFRGERGSMNQLYEAMHRAPQQTRTSFFAKVSSLPLFIRWNDFHLGPLRLPDYFDVFGPGDQAALNRYLQKMVETIDRAPEKGFDSRRYRRPASKVKDVTEFFTSNISHLLGGQPDMASIQMVDVRQTVIACALERYRLAHGEYPATLAALIPNLLPAIPKNVFTLQPMRYRRNADGTFRLWAAGRTPEADIVWQN